MELDEIKNMYNIESNNLEEIRAELKRILKECHPDNTGEDYDRDYFQKVSESLEYIEELQQNSKILVPMSEVVNAISEILSKPLEAVREEVELNEKLEDSVDKQLQVYRKRRKTSRISVTSITAIISFLWLIPGQLKKHPVIKLLMDGIGDNELIILSVIWGILIISVCIYWIISVWFERKQKDLIKDLKLESVQNRIFMRFLRKEVEERFSKDNFINYLYHVYDKEGLFFKMVLSEEMAQNLADIILKRAEDSGVVKKVNAYSLIDHYEKIKE